MCFDVVGIITNIRSEQENDVGVWVKIRAFSTWFRHLPQGYFASFLLFGVTTLNLFHVFVLSRSGLLVSVTFCFKFKQEWPERALANGNSYMNLLFLAMHLLWWTILSEKKSLWSTHKEQVSAKHWSGITVVVAEGLKHHHESAVYSTEGEYLLHSQKIDLNQSYIFFAPKQAPSNRSNVNWSFQKIVWEFVLARRISLWKLVFQEVWL